MTKRSKKNPFHTPITTAEKRPKPEKARTKKKPAGFRIVGQGPVTETNVPLAAPRKPDVTDRAIAEADGPPPASKRDRLKKAVKAAIDENDKRAKERAKAKDGMTASERAMAETAPPVAKRTTLLDATAIVLKDAGKPMRCSEIIAEVFRRGLWSTPAGKTPQATLYGALAREIRVSKSSRFEQTGPGLFALAGGGR